ncbi:hypothetical protein TEA_029400 [Camellia sinensis var. sinensis]|uniref:Multidrug and toxic compound extrusion protein n=1 Tax=Camellia sinensis var. sinensis TaxID=542762 RepID=A0A4S4D0F8_CAMSN|nr:hypothetical protein TEA_029400 [Camellia sinensis var. sinensis]
MLELHNLPNSPTHRFSHRVHPCELTSLPSLFSSSSSNPPHARILHQFSRIQTVPCFKEPVHFPIDLVETSSSHAFQSESKVEDDDTNSTPSDVGLIQHATWIGFATITSKILGLIREIIVASVFGIGPVATAFKYAYVLPGFSASLLGGVNGPIHITMATTLSKLSKERQKKLFLHINFVLFLVGGLIGALVLVTAEFIIHLYAPGAEGNNVVPSISPVLSSMLIIAGCFTYAFARQLNAFQTGDLLFGGILVSCGASLGVFLQWVIQVIVLWRRDYSMIPLSWMSILEDKDVHAFFSLLLPATISLAFAHIASFTDLCFSSLIPGATAGLSYFASILCTPIGTSIVQCVEMELVLHCCCVFFLNQIFSMVVSLPILTIMCVLAEPIICVLFERYAFDSAASTLVSSLFILYALGSPFYIVRELLVVVFYALGDGKRPFLVSVGATALNATLDWLFISKFYFGAQGLALSTSFTTALSVLVLFHLLQKKLSGVIDYAALLCPLLLLLLCCILSGFTTTVACKMICNVLSSVFTIRFHKIQELLAISLAGTIGMITFFFPLVLLHLSGFQMVRDLARILAYSPGTEIARSRVQGGILMARVNQSGISPFADETMNAD